MPEGYRRVGGPGQGSRPGKPRAAEVRVRSHGQLRYYVRYCLQLFEKGHAEVELVARGRASNKLVAVVEIVKQQVAGLSQETRSGTQEMTDRYEPVRPGLPPVQEVRSVSTLAVTLRRAGGAAPGA